MAAQKHKLWVKGFNPDASDDEIRRLCSKAGKFIHMTRPRQADYVFLTYNTDEEALQANANFVRDRMTCNYATTPKRQIVVSSASSSSPTNTSPSNSSSSPTNSEPSSTNGQQRSPSNARRVHFATIIRHRQIDSHPGSSG